MKRPFTILYRLAAFLSAVLVVMGCQVVKWQKTSAERKVIRHGFQSHRLVKDGFDIHFWKGGNGPTVLFLHGFGGDGLTTWKEEMLAIAENYTVIVPDLLWFGESSYVGEANLTSQSKAIELLLSELKVEQLTLVGQSYGGFIALDYFLNHSEQISKLIFANCPGHTFNYDELNPVCNNFKVATIEELFVFDEPEKLQRLYDLAAYKSITVPQSVLKQTFELYFNDHLEEKRQLLRSLPGEKEHFETTFKPNITCHVVWGEQDELFSLSSGERFARTIDGNFHVLKNCGHAPQLDNRKAFTRLISELIGNE